MTENNYYNVILTDTGKWIHAPGSDFLFAFLMDNWDTQVKNDVIKAFEKALSMSSTIKNAVKETCGQDVVNGLYLLNQSDMTKAMNSIHGMGETETVQKGAKGSRSAVEINKQFFNSVLAGLSGDLLPLMNYLTEEMGNVQAQTKQSTVAENFGTVIGLVSLMPDLNVPVTTFQYAYASEGTSSWFVKLNCGSAEHYSYDYSYTIVSYNYESS